MIGWKTNLRAAQVLGSAASGACVALYTMLICTPRAPSMGLYTPVVLAVVVAIGVVAATMGKSLVLLVTAVVSFVPVGLYLLHAVAPFALIGWLNILTAFAAVVMGWAQAVISLRPEE